MNKMTSNWLRIILGLFIMIYGLNQFLHIFPTSYGRMPEEAREFLDSIVNYLPFLYIFEILIGILLIFNKWTSLVLIVLFPLTIAFVMFVITNKDMSEMWQAGIAALLNILLIYDRREKYLPLLD